MDFHSLARKDLQSLCKKNKIPANLTNVAMADALQALHKVEGLDELGNAQESPERPTNAEPRTTCRTSTRRKLVKVETESSQPLTHTRRTTRRMIADNESKNVNLPETPAPNNRRRGPAASTRRKIDSQLIECGEDEKREVEEKSDMAKTPAIRSSRNEAPAVSTRRKVETQKDEKSVQRVYGKRQSVRLLEKTMEGLNLKEERKVEAVKIEGLCDETEEIEQAKDYLPDESLEYEYEKYEAVEDSKTNDHEVDQLPEDEGEMKHKVNNEDNKSEVDFDENQNIDQFLGCESERKVELPEDSKADDTEKTDCGAKLETETCASSDTYIQVETSDKAIDIIHESIEDKGSDGEMTDNPEKTLNSDPEMEMKKEWEGSPFVMEAEHTSITHVPGEISIVVNSLTTKKLNEDVSKSFEMNQQHMQKVESNAEEFNSDEMEKEFVMEAEHTSITHVPDEISEVVNSLTAEELNEDVSKSFKMNVVPEEEFAGVETLDKMTTTCLKEMSPCVSSAFAGNTIQGQFPRPTEATVEKMILVDIINEDKEVAECRKDDDKALLNDMSLRQLTKALKEKLQIKNNVSKVGTRIPLQKLPENAAAAEADHNN
ncbi:uncharacterized protein [Euphorbia lathyris]|uniref:uncharacterized protein isoform X2 n=1 Tax=Euphorbia lathyris TaxID=212925 RepID=UPI0033134EB7